VKIFVWSNDKEAFFAPTFAQKTKRAIFQTGMLLGILFVSGILYHAFSPIGFLTNPVAVAEVTRRFFSVDIPNIDLAGMEHIVAEEEMIPMFDSRFFRDFNRGTIPGAVSLPINSSLTERQQILGFTPKSQRMVVFCQSSGCGFADEIAQFLKFNGYNNVVIYRGGYREWSRRYDTEGLSPGE
jgi:rhodanese-related sulfurtransferase